VPPAFDGTEDVNDHAIGRDDDVILETVHSLPAIIDEPLVVNWATDFF
jgi:2-phosphoglycerate kinase